LKAAGCTLYHKHRTIAAPAVHDLRAESRGRLLRAASDFGTVFAADTNVKVRIRCTPREHELDGVRLDTLRPGAIREMPHVLASWLVAERYADVEMRHDARAHEDDFCDVKDIAVPTHGADAPRRRFNDH
jgi:hypothetical protein